MTPDDWMAQADKAADRGDKAGSDLLRQRARDEALFIIMGHIGVIDHSLQRLAATFEEKHA